MDYRNIPKEKKYTMTELVEESKKYEAERDRMAECGITSVQSVNCVIFNGIRHAAVVSHICTKPAGHDGNCRCCGYEWRGK